MLSANDWMRLREPFKSLKKAHSISPMVELKWDHLWLRKNQPEDFVSKNPGLAHLTFADMVNFVRDCVSASMACESCRLFFTVTENQSVSGFSKNRIWEMHLEELMPRVEMQINNDSSNLAVFFLDSTGEKNGDKDLRERYFQLVNKGAFFNHEHIRDGLAFEYSHHSYAIQMADFCAGIFNNMLRGYEESSSLFRMLYPKIVKSKTQEFMGYGVREVPLDKEGVRLAVRKRIGEVLESPPPRKRCDEDYY